MCCQMKKIRNLETKYFMLFQENKALREEDKTKGRIRYTVNSEHKWRGSETRALLSVDGKELGEHCRHTHWREWVGLLTKLC